MFPQWEGLCGALFLGNHVHIMRGLSTAHLRAFPQAPDLDASFDRQVSFLQPSPIVRLPRGS